MSGIPLEYWTGGMGAAMPAGRADPAACERLRNAVEQYGKWSKQPDSPTAIAERARYRKEWDNLKAQRACRPASPAPAPPMVLPPVGRHVPAASIPMIPTWVWVVAGGLVFMLAGGALERTILRKSEKEA